MKQRLDIWIGIMIFAGLLVVGATAQSLGEAARQERAKKGAPPAQAKVYTNDNLPASSGLSQAGAASSSDSSSTSPAAEAPKSEEKKEDRAKLEAEWRARFKAQKETIALLERETQIRKDELDWRPITAALQYDTRMSDDDQKRRSAQKEKDLAAAKQKLEDMRDELRKKDLPRTWGD